MKENKQCDCVGNDADNCKRSCKLAAVFILAAGIALGGFFPGYYYYQAKVNANSVTVKGLAEMSVKADLAVWDLKFVVTGNDLQTAQQQIETQSAMIIKFLQEQGLPAADIVPGRIETNDLMANPYRSANTDGPRFILNRIITVETKDVDLVDKALAASNVLIARGIIFDSSSYGYSVSYVFTKLNDIKPQMLEKATRNAKQAALEFAKNSGSAVGAIRHANQGVFSILPEIQTNNSMESQQINKKVRVVSTVEYWLK